MAISLKKDFLILFGYLRPNLTDESGFERKSSQAFSKISTSYNIKWRQALGSNSLDASFFKFKNLSIENSN